MHIFKQQRALFFLIISTFLFQANSFADESSKLLKEYNRAYDNYLKEKETWPKEFENFNSIYQTSKASYELDLKKVKTSKLNLEQAKSGVEKQQEYLNFLNKLEPVSNQKIKSLKQRVVDLKEFSNIDQVSLQSISSKTASLNTQTSDLTNQIQVEQSRISDIKTTNAVYLELNQQLSSLTSELREVQSVINNETTNIDNSKSNISNLQRSLDASMQSEDEARKVVIQITQIDLPDLERTRRNLNQNKDALNEDLRKTTRKRRNTNNALREVREKIQQKESELASANPDEVKQIQRDLSALKAESREFRRAVDEFDRQLSSINQSKVQNEFKISNVNLKISSLDQQAIDKRNEAAEEAIRQIDLESSIEDALENLRRAENSLSQSVSQRRSLESSISIVGVKLENFERDNIWPIQQKIDGLSSSRNKLTSRITRLREVSNNIIRQDNNILKARDLIKKQALVVDNIKDSIINFEADYEARVKNLNETKALLNSSIKDKNVFVISVQDKVSKLKEIQNELLNSNLEKEVENDK